MGTDLAPYQIRVGGETFGPGTDVQITNIAGLRSLPSLRTGNVVLEMQDGSAAGWNALAERPIQFTFQIATAPSLDAALSRLNSAWQNIPDPSTVITTTGEYLAAMAGASALPASTLEIQLPGRASPILALGRPTQIDTSVSADDYQYGYTKPTATFTVHEGALHATPTQQQSCGLPNPFLGFTFPLVFPLVFPPTSGGSFILDNTGPYPTWPTFAIAGPCQTPTVRNATTGQHITMATSLAATDSLIVDCQNGVVWLNGATARNNTIQSGSEFFMLPPGQNTIGFSTQDSQPVAATLTGLCLPAYSVV